MAGLVYVPGSGPSDGTEVTPLYDWMVEANYYKLLKNLKLFQNFLLIKCFRGWKKVVNRSRFEYNRRSFIHNSFLSKPSFVGPLLDIKSILVQLESVSLFAINTAKRFADGQFFLEDQTELRKDAISSVTTIVDNITNILVALSNDVSARAKVQYLDDDNELAVSERSLSMVELKKFQEQRIKAIKEARHEQSKLGDFIVLIDHMFVARLLGMVVSNFERTNLALDKLQAKDSNNSGLFQVEISFGEEDKGMIFNPSCSDLEKVFNDLFDEIERTIMNVPRSLHNTKLRSFFFSGSPPEGQNVLDLLSNDDGYNNSRENILKMIQLNFEAAQKFAEIFEPWRMIYEFGESNKLSELEQKDDWTVQEFNEYLNLFKEWETAMNASKVKRNLVIGVLFVNSKSLRDHLNPIPERSLESLKKVIRECGSKWCDDVQNMLRSHIRQLQMQSRQLEDFCEQQRHLNAIVAQQDYIQERLKNLDDLYSLMNEHGVRLSVTEVPRYRSVKTTYQSFQKTLNDAIQYRDQQLPSMQNALENVITDVKDDLRNVLADLHTGVFTDQSADPENVLEKLMLVRERINTLTHRVEIVNDQNQLLDRDVAPFSQLTECETQYTLRHSFWSLYKELNFKVTGWNNTIFLKLDVKKMSEEVNNMYKKVVQIKSKLYNDEVVLLVFKQLDEWRRRMIYLVELGNPAVQRRHWLQIFDQLSNQYSPEVTLQQLLWFGINNQSNYVLEICSNAVGEYVLELQLNKIAEEWGQTMFTVKEHGDDGLVLSEIEDIYSLLEDNMVSLQAMQSSRFIAGIREPVLEWEGKLSHLQDILDSWTLVQRAWMYLSVIFSQRDIQRQLPAESELFAEVNDSWMMVMSSVKREPLVLEILKIENLLETFVNANSTLEEIQKKLEEYLETKRASFPRFYFLSNDELLQVLSQTTNPTAIQPHLSKCFDAIERLRFYNSDDNELMINAMFSPQGEMVEFVSSVAASGAVEFWLSDVEAMMKRTVHKRLEKCLLERDSDNLVVDADWMFKHSAQSVLTVEQLIWTFGVTKALNKIETGDKDALKEFNKDRHTYLLQMVDLVKGNLTSLQRTLLSVLLVIGVHANVVTDEMIRDEVKNTNAFAWQKQLRYYWEDDQCFVAQTNARFKYGYEYLGNSPRLVITPLTDRCYITLTSALHFSLGGNPQGPAGTGKTETTKDLAKALGNLCVVMNCSSELEAKTMGRMFSGLAQVGAWACFDEFNRIEIEVLSVIAQQIMTIQSAVRGTSDHFHFEGRALRINRAFGCFITMNPGYAGRTELPDNLKALFRPISMLVPDYSLIAEITLYSEGFSDANTLSRKMVQLYKLSSEQLSQQDHYDFGMRAVKSVLVMAGALKRAESHLPEDVVLIRALRDSNIPKFLREDVPLFMGIISDLFPGIDVPSVDYGVLREAIIDELDALGYMPIASFVDKIQQLFETHIVRHGLMVVGAARTGKTTLIHTLQSALTSLHERGITEGPSSHFYKNVDVTKINPKALTMTELYGYTNPISLEWTDGLIGIVANKVVEDARESDSKKWILFDGPVDALWIENMNTVLDDNKMLTLANGQRIKLPDTINMLFEVEDLAEASPATVSRCGMVYLEAEYLGWRSIVKTWRNGIEQRLQNSGHMFSCYLDYFVDFYLREIKPKVQNMLEMPLIFMVQTCINLYEGLLTPFFLVAEESNLSRSKRSLENLQMMDDDKSKEMIGSDKFVQLDAMQREKVYLYSFLFAFYWSFGGCVDESNRIKFHEITWNYCQTAFIQTIEEDARIPQRLLDRQADEVDFLLLNKEIRSKLLIHAPVLLHNIQLNEAYTFFDYSIDFDHLLIKPYDENIPEFSYLPDIEFSEQLVPTIDTVRYKYLLNMLLEKGEHVNFVGFSGVGKTLIANDYLRSVEVNKWAIPVFTGLSGRTTSEQLQAFIENKWTRRRKTLLAGPPGKKMILFVDDLNMPKPEVYGAQPPLELIRQMIDQKSIYDREEFFSKSIADTMVVAACGPPGGGRHKLPQRLSGNINTFFMPELSDNSLKRIFTSLLNGFFTRFDLEEALDIVEPLVKASIQLYDEVKKTLLPTPSKSHYTFNLRDLGSIFRGLVRAPQKELSNNSFITRLWLHESKRAFSDRLINGEDVMKFNELLLNVSFHKDVGVEISNDQIENLVFCDFSEGFGEALKYSEANFVKLKHILYAYLEDFNLTYPQHQMDLVFFQSCIEHICRTASRLSTSGAHCLLIGVGGSGKQSIARFSCHIVGVQLFTVNTTGNYGVLEFREDLKKAMLYAGCNNKATAFLITDSQITDESFLEDVNNILNTGDIPGIWLPEDMEQISNALNEILLAENIPITRDNLLLIFTKRLRKHLHVILALSPVGSSLRNRIRQFPALVNCCSLDWYHDWPRDALNTVANHLLGANDLVVQAIKSAMTKEEITEKLVTICANIHSSVIEKAEQMYIERKRKNFVTPTSYLNLLNLFNEMLERQSYRINNKIERFESGLSQLSHVNELVIDLKKSLTQMQPELAKQSKKTEDMLVKLLQDEKIAEKQRNIVQDEEATVSLETEKTQEIADECKAILDEAMPAFNAATEALNTLQKKDIDEVRVFTNPHRDIVLVMDAVCVLMKEPTGWENGRRLLSNSGFLKSLENFDKDHIPIKIRNIIKRRYINRVEFSPDSIERVSVAVKCICQWVIALSTYADVAEDVAPKKTKLAEAEANLNKILGELKEKQIELASVEQKLSDLRQQYQIALTKKENIENNIKLTATKLERAEKLTNGLAGERVRWEDSLKQLKASTDTILGDVLLSAASAAYLGPFSMIYRSKLVKYWIDSCVEANIPINEEFNLAFTLSEPIDRRDWVQQSLPDDPFSLDNAVILKSTEKWPLLIDPQGQANRWIKLFEADNGLKVIRLGDNNFSRTLENCIRVGTPLLIENIGETLDPILEPVLLKQITSVGGRHLVRLGDQDVDWSPSFKLYMTTKLANPMYVPEIAVKTTIIDFTVTQKGLEDQLLAGIIRTERPELEQQKDAIVVNIANDKKLLKAIEDKILDLLATANTDTILEDEILIEALENSKVTATSIEKRVYDAEITAQQINDIRNEYRALAHRGSLIYFVIADLSTVDSMYQWSLAFFQDLMLHVVQNCRTPANFTVADRLNVLINDCTRTTFMAVSQGLFEEHKLLFSFLVTMSLLLDEGIVEQKSYTFLLHPPTAEIFDEKDEAMNKFDVDGYGFLGPSLWAGVIGLSQLNSKFENLAETVRKDTQFFRTLLSSNDPLNITLPFELTVFERLLFFSVFRREKVPKCIEEVVISRLGKDFVSAPAPSLAEVFASSNPISPIIFVLSPGADPSAKLMQFAAEQGKTSEEVFTLSLGQGQGPIAEALIDNAIIKGQWVFLQNCHLCTSWMPNLERKLDELSAPGVKISPDFRLWLTSMPSKSFPVPVLQAGTKITNEPPRGVRLNILDTLGAINDELWKSCVSPMLFHQMIYGLVFFHVVLQERKRYGPIGFNIPYEWMLADFSVSARMLSASLNEFSSPPWDYLEYMLSIINYSGRVTDPWDQRCVETIFKRIINPGIMETGHTLTVNGIYKVPDIESLNQLRSYVLNISVEDSPEIFGLHSNASVVKQQQECQKLLDTIIDLQPHSIGADSQSSDQIVLSKSVDLLNTLPKLVSRDQAHESMYKFGIDGAMDSLDVVQLHETHRYQKLLKVIEEELINLARAIKGEVVMSESLERTFNAMLVGRVPITWTNAGYPSVFGLSKWYKDLIQRIEFINTWRMTGVPVSFWLPGFFFPQSFLTAVLQQHARKHFIPIDTLRFNAEVLNLDKNLTLPTKYPNTGVFIHGLFLEGAEWDSDIQEIREPTPGLRKFFSEIPCIWLKPTEKEIITEGYNCPLYKTPMRAGALSTTGQSTNFIMSIYLPTKMLEEHWVQRGVALLCQPRDD
eukprot:TRINITY_DN3265_c0_g1_i1.p1 TRINITY_DN3265_c0_g1~~TRINITY_DN3265_c0_g1_i1.p1  ORF type:complete len:4284 (+),score=1224.26 TRINITY_DN3265_c0_g1_i1:1098-12854(+)